MPTLSEAFPHDDPVARFVVSMSMAANDLERVHRLAGQANEADSPDFTGYVRWSLGFLVEAQVALAAYRGTFPEVPAFLRLLTPDGKAALSEVTTVGSKLGAKLAEHTRNHSFHYPAPNRSYDPDGDQRLAAVLESLTQEPAVVSIRRDAAGRAVEQHLEFADLAALGVNFQPYALDDQDELLKQQTLIRDSALAFRTLAVVALEVYLGRNGQVLEKKDL